MRKGTALPIFEPREPYRAAIRLLFDGSPAAPTGRWIGAWMLLRKVRSTAALAATTALVICVGLYLFTPVSIARAILPFLPMIFSGLSPVLYYLFARFRLPRDLPTPHLTELPGIIGAMAPFDGVAKEYIRRQNGHAS